MKDFGKIIGFTLKETVRIARLVILRTKMIKLLNERDKLIYTRDMNENERHIRECMNEVEELKEKAIDRNTL